MTASRGPALGRSLLRPADDGADPVAGHQALEPGTAGASAMTTSPTTPRRAGRRPVRCGRWAAMAPPEPARCPGRACPAVCFGEWRPGPGSRCSCPTAGNRAPDRRPIMDLHRSETASSPGSAGTARSDSARRTWPAIGTRPICRAARSLGPPGRHPGSPVRPGCSGAAYDPASRRRGAKRPPGARRNIVTRHYDLSNDLFAAFLDASMTYSSALFCSRRPSRWRRPRPARSNGCSTPPASAAARGCSRSARVGASWPCGPLARGARVTGLTLSAEQGDWPGGGSRPRGCPGSSTSVWRTTATSGGQFDAVVSVEMIEAVGDRWWPTYFQARCDDRLAPGGPDRTAGDRDGPRPAAGHPAVLDVDPQVHLSGWPDPVRAGDRRHVARHTSLRVVDRLAFGDSYARTLGRGANGSAPRPSWSTSWASTTRSGVCGTSISPTARPVSGAATSTWPSWSWREGRKLSEVTVRVSMKVPAGREQVWSELACLGDHVEWMLDATAIRFRSGQREGVGTVFECDTKIGPFSTHGRDGDHRMGARKGHRGQAFGPRRRNRSLLAHRRPRWGDRHRMARGAPLSVVAGWRRRRTAGPARVRGVVEGNLRRLSHRIGVAS